MADKSIKTRVQLKRGSQSDWATAEAAGFKPLEGEHIFYSDLNKSKIGKKDSDGNLIPLSQLDFTNANDADTLDGKHASEFVLKTDAKAPVDAEKNVQSDWDVTDTSSDAFIKNKPKVIIEGDSRLTDARTPTAHSQAATTINEDATHRFVTDTEKAVWNAKSNFSGNYNDLTNKPTIPTVNDKTLTIQKNGTTVSTFTANSTTDVTANITVPTKTSELTNDSGFKTVDTNTTYDLSAPASKTNGNVTINLVAGGSGSGTDSVVIKGVGATTVATDANGVITISSTDTVIQDSNDNQTVKTGNVIFGANDVIEFVAGTNVSINGDSTNKKITISSTDTNTHNSHTIISGKKADGTTDIKGSLSSGDITLGDSGVTAGKYGPDANKTPSYGNTFNVPEISVNAKGIITAVSNRTVQIPASDNTDTGATSVEVVGTGNAVTTASYDSTSRKLTLTKGAAYLSTSLKGAVNGLAELDANGKVLTSQLPSYVDDVIEGTLSTFPATGETGKIYVDTTTNKTYRWSGSAFVEISASLALGETSSTAYRGDRGKIAYDHSQATHAPSNAEKNQNAFSNIAVSGQTTVEADSTTDTLTLVAGSNVTITTDATNDKITIAAKDTVYTHPTSGVTAGSYNKVTVDANGHVTSGSNPTTLAGYGIADAYTKTAIDTALAGKAASSHGTHVTYATAVPVMDGTAAVGTATTVARGDHKHPTDTSRASAADLTTLTTKVNTLISHGTSDPTSSTASQYYFKYN